MADKPVFVGNVNTQAVSVSTANTNRDGTGTIGTLYTAGANGSRVHKITVKATDTTTAGMIRFFLHNGSAYFLYLEIAVNPITPSASQEAFGAIYDLFGENAIVIPSGWSIRVSTNNAENFNVIAEGGDF